MIFHISDFIVSYKANSRNENMIGVLQQLQQIAIIPVVKINDAQYADQLAHALVNGGIPIVEITFRTTAAEQAIDSINRGYSRALVGAGTVLTVEQAQRAVGAGARFIVSPGFTPKVVNWCLENGITIFPGVATATEVILALDNGINVLKFFPADALGGIDILKAYASVFPDVKFIPTGGITINNLRAYLGLQNVNAVGGSWIAKNELISEGKYKQITQNAREACSIRNEVRLNRGE
jgi:2-dehydro-3-deoxyphosphogluconate aldolase/(4S)-4-hydroxy-2-oxoglutarate aldolase